MKPRSLLVLLPLFACGGAGANVDPKSGEWSYYDSEIVDNDCGPNAPIDPNGSFTLTVTGGGKFSINDGGYDDAFECTYSGGSFNCPVRAAKEESQVGVDAVAKYNVSVEGSIDSATEVSGVQTVQISCDGADCSIIAGYFEVPQLPCSYSYSFSGSAK
jgi:hypothetical protein